MLTRVQVPLADIAEPVRSRPLVVDRLAELKAMSKVDERLQMQMQIQQSHPLGDSIIDTVNEIKQEIKVLSERLSQLEQLHKRSLMSVDAEEAHRHSSDLDALNQKISATAASIRTKLSGLSPLAIREGQGRKEEKASKLAQTQQRKLGKSFLAVMRLLEESQNQYKQQLRQQLQRQYLIVNPEATAQDLESLGDDQHQQASYIHIYLIN